jgi:hypothetical protein
VSEHTPIPKKDLVVLVADNNMRATIQAILKRPEVLGIRTLSVDVFVHVHRDPGVLSGAHEFLAPLTAHYKYALVMFDRKGCGREEIGGDLSQEVQSRLDSRGWVQRSAVIIIDPELEVWVWSDSPHVPEALGLSSDNLESLLRGKYRIEGQVKPAHPKEAMEEALWISRTPRSSSVYSRLAQRVSLERCKDQAFLRLKACLQEWFSLNKTP